MKLRLFFFLLVLVNAAIVDAKKRIDASKEVESKNAVNCLPPQRMTITSSEILSEAANCESSVTQLQEAVANKMGFIISSSITPSKQNRNIVTVIMLVPATSFDGIMNDIAKLSSRIIAKSISRNDVTDEYTRVSAQLANRKNTERRYHEILRSAKKVEEIIAVEKYFAEVREEIERLERERQSLNNKVSFITITVTFQLSEQNSEAEEEDKLRNIGTGVGRNLTGAANIIDLSISFLISILPVVLFLVVPGFFLFKLSKKYRLVKREKADNDASSSSDRNGA